MYENKGTYKKRGLRAVTNQLITGGAFLTGPVATAGDALPRHNPIRFAALLL
jgi:hypothetical protein